MFLKCIVLMTLKQCFAYVRYRLTLLLDEAFRISQEKDQEDVKKYDLFPSLLINRYLRWCSAN